jgi:hypothetical protein
MSGETKAVALERNVWKSQDPGPGPTGLVAILCSSYLLKIALSSSTVNPIADMKLLVIGSSFLGANCQGLRIVSSEPLASAFERSKPLPEKVSWPPLPVFGRRVFDKVVLCQIAGGFQTGLDIAQQPRVRKDQAIWE